MNLYEFLLQYWISIWIDVDLGTITLFTCEWFTIRAIDVFNIFYIISLSLITCWLFIFMIYRLFKWILGIKNRSK